MKQPHRSVTRCGCVALCGTHFGPREAGTDVGATSAAYLADEPVFDIGEPQAVGPSVGVHCDYVAAFVVGARNGPSAVRIAKPAVGRTMQGRGEGDDPDQLRLDIFASLRI